MTAHPTAILCIGRNYASHAVEMNAAATERPTVFMKNPASATGRESPIVIPRICNVHGPQVDYEGELAVIIGRDCRDADEESARDYISGWAVANDVTARWWQKKGSGGQWIRGKSFDTFCPLSPPVPTDAIDNPQGLTVTTRVNGEVRQHGNTSDMLFPVATLIAELSRGMTLLKGTVLLTGTPEGVGAARTPPVFLMPGDVVEVEIPGVGSLHNTVTTEESAAD
ncbi:MAG: fumarylacetoacetate hydrolase family protein [Planctomycetes bacterium]|jgi:2-keto-4-pentenoate hydratase/2-oxohepta-3-ene-1,7-dioic acid hydratase in catechol pathway|nr:fumarylacetoacetate hydrolase family protein [Planctomycetota bacterium]MCP4839877.1 fumarylacetoacetate hydrolase family protein [Planctomycetota bacterium]